MGSKTDLTALLLFYLKNMNSEIRKGLIYFRVSTEEQAQFGVSLDQQEKSCFDHAKRNNIEIIKAFHDDGVSAKTTKRDGLQDMMSYCKKNHKYLDCVIVYKIDRLTRNLNDYTNILIMLNKLGIRLISITEPLDNTAMGNCIGNIMASFAQFDNEVKGERVTSCMKEKILQGYWCGIAPIGYLNSRDGFNKKVIILDPEKAPLVKFIFEKFSTGLFTLEEIKQMVNKKNLRTKKGKVISNQIMSKLIRNKFYYGMMEWKGEEQKGNYEPLITEELFDKCQRLLKTGKTEEHSKDKKNGDFPLKHFAICGFCGRPLTASFSTGKSGKKFPYYRCYNAKCPSKKSIAKKKLEKEFIKYLKKITPNEDYLKYIKPIIIDVWDTKYKEINQEREKAEIRIEELKKEKAELMAMKKRGLLSDADFMEELHNTKEQILEEQIKLEETKLENFDIREAVDYVFDFIQKMSRLWEKADFESKVKIQSLIFPEKVIYQYNGFETPHLSVLFAQKKEFCNSLSPMVPPRRIELLFSG